uniref:(California timema) hypothetical protein n=1 Tax=Timema californicum TaxID=61474 RepID=A0A7R9PF51_TIMCA|nr:unnamed protein product [Timema californicum]
MSPNGMSLANTFVVLSSTAEDGEIEVQVSDSKDRQMLYFNSQELETIKFSGLSENDVRNALASLQDWVRQQPHLPGSAGE